MPLVDTLLRLAERPDFYVPKWSPDILQEVERTLRARFGYLPMQVGRRIDTMTRAFPDAMVTAYEDLIPAMTNDPKDRHVVAAAVRCGARIVVSDNIRHFPKGSLAAYGMECLSADAFLTRQYERNPDAFKGILVEQASDIGWTLAELAARHVASVARLIAPFRLT
jgi:hypothetical protein